MSESVYISSYEGCKILSIEYEEKDTEECLNSNSDKYEGVKLLTIVT